MFRVFRTFAACCDTLAEGICVLTQPTLELLDSNARCHRHPHAGSSLLGLMLTLPDLSLWLCAAHIFRCVSFAVLKRIFEDLVVESPQSPWNAIMVPETAVYQYQRPSPLEYP
jgi:hypothetical protein